MSEIQKQRNAVEKWAKWIDEQPVNLKARDAVIYMLDANDVPLFGRKNPNLSLGNPESWRDIRRRVAQAKTFNVHLPATCFITWKDKERVFVHELDRKVDLEAKQGQDDGGASGVSPQEPSGGDEKPKAHLSEQSPASVTSEPAGTAALAKISDDPETFCLPPRTATAALTPPIARKDPPRGRQSSEFATYDGVSHPVVTVSPPASPPVFASSPPEVNPNGGGAGGVFRIRASSLPLAMVCPGSLRGLRVDEVNEAAALGTAAHELFRQLPETGRIDPDSIPAIAAKHGVDAVALTQLVKGAESLWPALAPEFPEAVCETAIKEDLDPADAELTGQIDMLATVDGEVRILDWKTGFKDSDYSAQMRAYCTLAMCYLGDSVERARATVAWVRTGEVEYYSMTAEECDAFLDDVSLRVANWDGVFHAGAHCRFCHRSHDCTAATAMFRRDMLALTGGTFDLATMTGQEIIDLRHKAAMAKSIGERVAEAISAHVKAGNEVEGDKTRLVLTQIKKRKISRPRAAWRVLQNELGWTTDDYDAVVEISPAQIEARAKERAAHSDKEAAARETIAALADVIETTPTTRIEEKRK